MARGSKTQKSTKKSSQSGSDNLDNRSDELRRKEMSLFQGLLRSGPLPMEPDDNDDNDGNDHNKHK